MTNRIWQGTRFRKFSLALTALSVLAFLSVAGAFATTITFPDFPDVSAFTLNGTAAAINNPVFLQGKNVLRLTDGTECCGAGSAFLTNAVALGSGGSFSTFFEFQMSDPEGISDGDGPGADGLVFVVQSQAATALGGIGQGIGYSGITPSLGVEFDTFDNGFLDNNNGNHLGINLNGNVDSVALNPVAGRFNDTFHWFAWVDYDGTQDLLQARVSQTATRPTSAKCHTLDLPGILGQSSAFIGFTSGTDAASSDHDIRTWEFTDANLFTLDPGDCLDFCGNGIVDPGEVCDGSNDAVCIDQCTAACTCTVDPGDPDGDGILDDGDGSGTAGDNPCTGTGVSCNPTNTANCDDNCPTCFNPGQLDCNNNGIGNCCEDPLLIQLESFTSEIKPGGVLLKWRTTAETNNIGFRILRARNDEEPVVISPLIPARGTELSGAEYEYFDRDRQRLGTVKYYVEDIDSYGLATRNGPADVEFTRRAPERGDSRRSGGRER